MAKFKISQVGKDMRGLLGDTVWQESRNGLITRSRVIPVNPQSSQQMGVRGNFTLLTRQWAGLPSANKQAWKLFADTREYNNDVGNKSRPTGMNMFVGINQDLAAIGAPQVLVPPPTGSTVSSFASGSALLTTMSNTITGFSLSLQLVGGAALGADEYIYARLSPPSSGGEDLLVVMTKWSAINTGAPYNSLTPDVLADYTARFGNSIGAYQVIGVGVKIVNATTGLSSPYLKFLVEQNVAARRSIARNGNGHRAHGNGNGNGHGSKLAFRRNGNGRKLVSK